MSVVLAALSLGLAGSLHCVAMCGPLIGVMSPAFGRRLSAGLWYHAGRLATYMLLGGLAGLVGMGLAVAGMGRSLSILAGGVLVATALSQGIGRRATASAWWSRQLSRPMAGLARARDRHPAGAAFGAGIVNGALPCGLVYAAALAATTAGGPLAALVAMLAFGAGTLPMMLGIWTTASRIPGGLRRRFQAAAPALVAVVGILLVVRGLAMPESHVHRQPPAIAATPHGH